MFASALSVTTLEKERGVAAKKLKEYDPEFNEASSYQFGNHKCWPKEDTRTRSREIRQKINERNLKGSVKEVAISQITNFIDSSDMEGAARECHTWVDRCTVERELQYSKQIHGIDNNSFDTVGLVK